MSTFSYAVPPPAPAAAKRQRYYIMGATSLPEGTAFATHESQRHLLTQFALGFLSVADVIECLSAASLTLPVAAAQ